ncbi:hypothetical protein ACHAWF_015002 [Thalassiosira exigua]
MKRRSTEETQDTAEETECLGSSFASLSFRRASDDDEGCAEDALARAERRVSELERRLFLLEREAEERESSVVEMVEMLEATEEENERLRSQVRLISLDFSRDAGTSAIAKGLGLGMRSCLRFRLDFTSRPFRVISPPPASQVKKEWRPKVTALSSEIRRLEDEAADRERTAKSWRDKCEGAEEEARRVAAEGRKKDKRADKLWDQNRMLKERIDVLEREARRDKAARALAAAARAPPSEAPTALCATPCVGRKPPHRRASLDETSPPSLLARSFFRRASLDEAAAPVPSRGPVATDREREERGAIAAPIDAGERAMKKAAKKKKRKEKLRGSESSDASLAELRLSISSIGSIGIA